jgi:pimeloyl-ACP methyl ester carboxylesterase
MWMKPLSRTAVGVLLLLLAASPPLAAHECVALLHGLWRSENSMNKMKDALVDAGYRVFNVPYESTEETVDVLAEKAVKQGLDGCSGASTVHFVTHSMGGILIRQYLENHDIPQLGRVVMLGPPNQGSEAVDRFASWPAYAWITGPAGLQLGTAEDSVPRNLGPVDFDLGIIAGTRTLSPIVSLTLPGKDDGKVSVDATRVEGMRDFLVLPTTHVFMMRNKKVIAQVEYYLGHGQFDHSGIETSP